MTEPRVHHMTWHAALEFLKYWLPITSAIGVAVKVYFTAKKALGRWFNRIGDSFESYLAKAVDNHMTHVQSDVNRASTAIVDLANYHKEMIASQRVLEVSAEKTAAAITSLAEYHKDTMEGQRQMVTTLMEMREDFHDHVKDDLRVQNAILTGIEVLKAKV